VNPKPGEKEGQKNHLQTVLYTEGARLAPGKRSQVFVHTPNRGKKKKGRGDFFHRGDTKKKRKKEMKSLLEGKGERTPLITPVQNTSFIGGVRGKRETDWTLNAGFYPIEGKKKKRRKDICPWKVGVRKNSRKRKRGPTAGPP